MVSLRQAQQMQIKATQATMASPALHLAAMDGHLQVVDHLFGVLEDVWGEEHPHFNERRRSCIWNPICQDVAAIVHNTIAPHICG